MLPDKVIAIYCFTDDLLKSIGHETKEGCRTTDAEIITTALAGALLFKGNQGLNNHYLRFHNMAPLLPKKSGFTKRLHGLCELLHMMFMQIGDVIKQLNTAHRYILGQLFLGSMPQHPHLWLQTTSGRRIQRFLRL
ncbi:MAG: hypothetical protein M3342_14510 [Bacteroidota bacterium]|nr:hypothetical protein [Bacteroidota bacterium]